MSMKDQMQEWLEHPGTKIILKKLMESGERAQSKYDKAKTHKDFIRLQIYRSVVLTQIPKVIEELVEEPGWKFWKWLNR